MATFTGPWSSNDRLQAILELTMSPTSVGTGTSSVRVDWVLKGRSRYASNEFGSTSTPYTVSGDVSASGNGGGWNVGAMGTWVIASGSKTFSTSYNGTVKVSVTGKFTSTSAYSGTTASVSGSVTIPQRPVSAPAAPSGLSLTASRDTLTATWTRNATTGAPYDSIRFAVSSDDGATYGSPVSLSGTATSRTFTGTPNRQYRFGVYAQNAAGYSSWAYSGSVWTTQPPTAPSSASVARVSDTQHTVSWGRTATTARPWDNVEVLRRDNVSTSYALVATVSGGSTSYSDKGTRSDRVYTYRVRAKNTAGTSGYATASPISTTPATPGAPTAVKNSAGDVVVTRPGLSAVATSWEVWHAANGVWDGARLALVNASTGSWTHASPNNAQTHAYRIRAVSSGPTLYSGYSGTSATVQLLAPPAAPTSLSPNGDVRDATVEFNATFRHNPVDTTPLRRKQFRSRVAGGSWVEEPAFGSSWEGIAFPASKYSNGTTVEWQVRTWGSATTGGSDGTGASPWSATAVITTSATPTAAPNAPDGTEPWPLSTLIVTWGYDQAQGSPQAQWQARLVRDGVVLETVTGVGDAGTATFKRRLADGASLSWEVRVQSAAGLWSPWAAQPFTVSYAKPPTPEVEVSWLPDEGAVVVTAVVPDMTEDQVPVESIAVWRSDGSGWSLVAEGVDPGASVTDHIPPLGAVVAYRAVAVSALPSTAESQPVEILTDDARYVFVNAGPGYSRSIRLGSNVLVDMTRGRAKVLHDFGRPSGRPVEFAGTALTRTLSVRADLWAAWTSARQDQSSWAEIEDLAALPGPHCYRDPDGRRFFVSMSEASIGGLGTGATRGVGFDLVEVDWAEPGEEAEE